MSVKCLFFTQTVSCMLARRFHFGLMWPGHLVFTYFWISLNKNFHPHTFTKKILDLQSSHVNRFSTRAVSHCSSSSATMAAVLIILLLTHSLFAVVILPFIFFRWWTNRCPLDVQRFLFYNQTLLNIPKTLSLTFLLCSLLFKMTFAFQCSLTNFRPSEKSCI